MILSGLLRETHSCTFVCYQCSGLYISNNVDSSSSGSPYIHTVIPFDWSFLFTRVYPLYYYTFVNIHYVYRHIIYCRFFLKYEHRKRKRNIVTIYIILHVYIEYRPNAENNNEPNDIKMTI